MPKRLTILPRCVQMGASRALHFEREYATTSLKKRLIQVVSAVLFSQACIKISLLNVLPVRAEIQAPRRLLLLICPIGHKADWCGLKAAVARCRYTARTCARVSLSAY